MICTNDVARSYEQKAGDLLVDLLNAGTWPKRISTNPDDVRKVVELIINAVRAELDPDIRAAFSCIHEIDNKIANR
jgi:hypothetical protein